MEPDRARHLARFAYLLGRVAHADRHVSPDETREMEALVVEEGRISADQAVAVVGLREGQQPDVRRHGRLPGRAGIRGTGDT